MPQLGKLLILVGLGVAALGVLLLLGDKIGLGRLPGDIHYRGKHTNISFPIVTSIVLSVIVTLLLNFFLNKK